MSSFSPIVLKILGGLSVAAAGATGSYFVIDNVRNSISVFDKGLIDFLNEGKNDIIFEVKTGSGNDEDSATTELSDSNFLSWSSDTSNPKWAVVKVSVSTSETSKFKKGNTAATDLKNLTNLVESPGSSWTWICSIKFSKPSGATSDLDEEYKKLIYKSENEGLLGILKKDNSSDQKDDIKQKKIKFIGDCGKQRKIEDNRKYNKERLKNDSNKKVKSEISFVFTEKGSQLEPEDKKLFNYWFK